MAMPIFYATGSKWKVGALRCKGCTLAAHTWCMAVALCRLRHAPIHSQDDGAHPLQQAGRMHGNTVGNMLHPHPPQQGVLEPGWGALMPNPKPQRSVSPTTMLTGSALQRLSHLRRASGGPSCPACRSRWAAWLATWP